MAERVDVIVAVLAIVGFLIAEKRGWFSRVRTAAMYDEAMSQRVTNMEKWIEGHERCSDKQIEILTEVREDLAFIKGQLANQ